MKKIFRIVVVCLLLGFFTVVEAHAGANVVPVKISGPAEAHMNQTISVTFRVRNDGNETSGAYDVGFYLSENRTINPEMDRLLAQLSFEGGLEPGQARSRSAKIVVPADFLGKFVGDCYYGMIVNGTGKAARETVTVVRYQDNGDGTVTDHQTGLMWEQSDSITSLNWWEAKAYCNNLTLAGREDWTLPPRVALETTLDLSRSDPAFDPVFKAHAMGPDYWSNTTFVVYPHSAWNVIFDNGLITWFAKSSHKGARCVRYAK